ncbi:MAG: RNA polymerase sigma factor [Salibacteraceae bacterium]
MPQNSVTDEADSLSDEELVKKISKTHDPALFGVLYDRYVSKVYNKCLMFTKNKNEAEDLTHDVFLKLYVNLSKFQGKSRFSTWLYSICYNFCVNYANRKHNRTTKVEDLVAAEHEPEHDDHEVLSLSFEKLDMAMEQINAEHKAILLMKFLDNMSIKEIAAATDLGESAVKMRIKRAKASLLKEYQKIQLTK